MRAERLALFQRLTANNHVVLALLAVVVGLLAGYGSVLFRLLVDSQQWLLFGEWGEERLSAAVRALPDWYVVAAPGLGGLVIGLVFIRWLPTRLPQGLADVIEANALKNARLSFNAALVIAAHSACSLGVGASTGREGPIVHLGAAIGSKIARTLHLTPVMTRTLLGCGASAGVAAAFNAPIAGVFFALEVVVGHYGLGAFSPVVIASVTGTIITRIHIGDDAAFSLPADSVTSFWEFPAFVLLGLVAALVAINLIRAVHWVVDGHTRLGTPPWSRPMLAGLATGGIALWYPDVLGVGYEATDAALRGEYPLDALIALAIAKGVATVLCLGSLFGGGVFSPSLFLGAMVGGAFGLIAGAVFPDLASSPGTYAILGMGAVSAAVLGAPISTVIMIFELTTNYNVTFALMVTVAVASLMTQQLFGYSAFTYALKRRKVELEGHREMSLLRQQEVRDVMIDDFVEVRTEAPLPAIYAKFHDHHAPIFVVDDSGKLAGTIDIADLADVALSHDADDTSVTAKTLLRPTKVMLVPTDTLAAALRQAEANKLDLLPVVDNREHRHVVGEVRYQDVLVAYNRALLRARAVERGED